MHSFYLAYFTQSNYFETHLCSIISSNPPYTNLYLFFQTSPLPLNSPLEALRSTDKSRINHFSRSLPHAKYYFPIIQCFTSPLSISHRPFLLSEQKDKCFMLLTSSKTKMSNLESITKEDPQENCVKISPSPLLKKQPSERQVCVERQKMVKFLENLFFRCSRT